MDGTVYAINDATLFAVRAAANHAPWHNAANRLDVSFDGLVAPDDVLLVVNFLNAFGAGAVPPNAAAGAPFYDVTGDNHVAPSDVLTLINHFNTRGAELNN